MVDTRLALTGQPINMMMPHEAIQAGYQTQAMKQRNAMTDMAMQDAEAAKQGKARLNALYQQHGGDFDKMLASGQLDMDTAVGLMNTKNEQAKLQGEAAKQNAQADKARMEGAIEKLNYGSQLLQGATPDNWQDIRKEFYGMTGQDLGEQFDPNKVGALQQQGLAMKDKLANEWKAKGYELDVARFGETRRHNQVSEGISQQNANKYSGAEGGIGKPKNQVIYDAAGKAYIVDVNNPDEQPRPIEVGGSQISKPTPSVKFTESQTNAAMFGARAGESDRIIDEIGVDFDPLKVGIKSKLEDVPLLGMAAGASLTSNEQKYDQAKRDFINALLRKESGSAIGKDEFSNADKQYFPQPGDSKEVREQKSRNRKLAIQGLNQAAGEAAYSSPSPDLSAADEEAMTWAKSNPNDPRAIAIIKQLGGK